MRIGIGALLFALFSGSSACISGDIDEEKKTDTLPAGIDGEAATFFIAPRGEGAQQALVVRLSSVSLCERAEVPLDHPFVELELVIPADAQFAPEECRIDQTFRCRVRLQRTTAPECASAAGVAAAFGHVRIDEVTEDVVRGSFVGTSKDSKLDLRGSFVARPCGGGGATCP